MLSISDETKSHMLCFQPLEIFVDDETKLTLHGLQQYYLKLEESQKNRKLNDLLDTLAFNKVRTFIPRCSLVVVCSVRPGRHLRQVSCSCGRARQTSTRMLLPVHHCPF